MKTKFLAFAVLTFLFIVACQTDDDDVFVDESLNKEIPVKPPIYVDLVNTSHSVAMKTASGKKMEVVLYMAEYITDGNSQEMGNTIFFNNRGNKQLFPDFVPDVYLPFLPKTTNDITYYVDESRPSTDMPESSSNVAIMKAMTTWDEVTCSDLGITKEPYVGRAGFMAGLYGYGDANDPIPDPTWGWVADVVHSGWMPSDSEFFNDPYIGFPPNGRSFILGVTFTFIVVVNGVWLDEDNNGRPDVWFREIYYNDAFSWKNGSTFDVETVALHEAGHGLSQGHFGKAFGNKGGVHFAPRAVMNAAYTGVQTSIEKTDNGGHCSNWGQWPNN